MSSWLSIVVGCALAAVIVPRAAAACDCMPPPPPGIALAKAPSVFAGRVVASDAPLGGTIRLQVFRAWKGARAGEEVVIERASGVTGGCDYTFDAGTTHLVYTYARADGKLDVIAGHCGRSRVVDEATDNLDALVGAKGASADAPSAPSATTTPAAPPPVTTARGCGGCGVGAGSRDGAAAMALAACAIVARRRSRARRG